MATKSKQPSEVRDFDINIVADDGDYFIASPAPTVTIVAVPSTDEPSPTLVAGPGIHPEVALLGAPTTGTAKVWLGSGTTGVKYKVTTVLNTAFGRVLEHDFFVKVKDK